MRKLLKVEEKINRLVDKCRRLEAELDQGVLDFSKAESDKQTRQEIAMLQDELSAKENKLKQIATRMEKLQSLVKSL